jgi:hypothetical protein
MSKVGYAPLLLLLSGGVVACGSDQAADPGEVGVYDGDAASVTGRGDATTPSLEVTIAAGSTVVCPGECATLTATAAGGSPPYTYAWDHGLPAGAEARVCPTTTTTYGVTATDSAGHAGEIAAVSQQGSATATVAVADACTDAGAPIVDAGAPDTTAPTGTAHALCSEVWPLSYASGNAGWRARSTQGSVAVDPAGNIYVAATFSGTAQVGAAAFTAAGTHDVLVAKLDGSCNVLWARRYGGALADVYVDSIAVDAQSSAILGGSLNGTVDFGTGAVSGSFNAAIVFKLDASGNTTWAHAYGGALSQDAVDDLTVDATGNVVFIAEGSSNADFGGAVVNAQDHSFVVELGSDGSRVFSEGASTFGGLSPSGVATGSGGRIWLAGQASSGGDASTPVAAQLVALAADGSLAWTHGITPRGSGLFFYPFVRVGPADEAVMAYVDGFTGDAGTTTVVRSLGSFSATGVPGWTNGASYLNDEEGEFDWGNQFALDHAGNAFVGGEFSGSLALGALGSLTAVGPTDVEVKVLDTSGALRAAGSWGQAGLDLSPHDIAVDSKQNAVVVGWAYTSSAGPQDEAFFVTKLGW